MARAALLNLGQPVEQTSARRAKKAHA
jgi:hypothetical protein